MCRLATIRSHTTTQIIVVIAAALIASACSGGGTPSSSAPAPLAMSPEATARTTPQPQPTPDPDAVAAAFLDFAKGRTLPWVVTYSGAIIGDDIDVSVDAELKDIGESEAVEATVVIDGKRTNQRSIRVHDDLYVSTEGGPWIPAPILSTYDFMKLFANVEDLELLRVEDEGSVTCWWFRASGAQVPAEVFQIATNPAPEFTTTSFEIELGENGRPMSVEVEADVVFGSATSKTAHATYRWEFSQIGDSRRIALPQERWDILDDQKCGFTAAYPPALVPSPEETECSALLDVGDGVGVIFVLVPMRDITVELHNPLTDSEAFLISDGYYSTWADAAISRETTELDGQHATLSTYKWKDSDTGQRMVGWLVLQRRDAGLYLIDGWAPAGLANQQRRVFEAILATVSIAK